MLYVITSHSFFFFRFFFVIIHIIKKSVFSYFFYEFSIYYTYIMGFVQNPYSPVNVYS